MESLLPGLLDEIAVSCLARVPRKHIPLLNCVSKKWNDLVNGEDWHSDRTRHNLDETWIYALCRNNSGQLCLYVLDSNELQKGWKKINGIPNRCLKRKGIGFAVLGRKLYLIGGCGWIEDPTDKVYCYDALANSWAEAISLSTARCYFDCESLNGKIYAIGGLGSKPSNPFSWDIYDPQTNSWTFHEDLNVRPQAEDSVVLNGKLYIRCCSSPSTSSLGNAIVYEPSSATWRDDVTHMVCDWRGPVIVIDGVFYVLNQISDVKIMMWEGSLREWVLFKSLPTNFAKSPCEFVAIGKRIFVIGKGLGTVVFDVENDCNVGDVLVSSSDVEVISCKPLSL